MRHLSSALLLLAATAAHAGDFEDEVSYQGRTLSEWIGDLSGKDRAKRLHASRVLREVGPEADGSVAALLLGLKTDPNQRKQDDDDVGDRIGLALARMGPNQVPILAVAVALDNAGIRFGAARALAALGPRAKPAARRLARQLQAPSPRDRIVCALALYHVDGRPAAVAALRKELKNDSDEEQAWAAWSLEQCGPDAAPAAPELVELLDHPSEYVRYYVFTALESIGRPAVAPLVEALDSRKVRQRIEAAEALGRIGPEASEAVPALILLSRNESAGARAAAARALGRIGDGDRKTLDALKRSLRDDDADVRLEAARALERLGANAGPAADAICQALLDERPIRRAAAAALVRVGKPAVEPLVRLLADDDDLVRRQAIECLGALAPDDGALRALEAVARDPRDALRSRAVTALAGFGRKAVRTLAALLADASVRADAATALARLGTDAAPAHAALTDALAHDDPTLRATLLRALVAIGEAESIPALVKLHGQDEASRLAILTAFARLPGAAKEWVPTARQALKDKRPLVRLEALAALASAGAEAKPAVAEIVARLKDENAPVRRSAGQVLVLLGETDAVLPHARALLASKDAADRRSGLELIAWLGASAKDERQAVRARLKDDGLAAVAALTEIDADDDSGTSTLAALLAGKSREPALFRLIVRRGAKAKGMVAALASIADGTEPLPIRVAAARTLGAIGPEAKTAAPALLKLLLWLERRPDVEEMAARDLIRLGKAKEVTVPPGDVLEDADLVADAAAAVEAVRQRGLRETDEIRHVQERLRELAQSEVLDALARIGPGVVPAVSEQLASESSERRRLAARVLARLGPAAKDAAPALLTALKDGDVWTTVEAARALNAVSGETEAVVAVLRAGLKGQGVVAGRAARGLADLGPAAKPALAELLIASRSRNTDLRRESVRALGVCDGDAEKIRPALEPRLLDASDAVRVVAAVALASVAKVDPVPQLAQIVRFSDDRLARVAAAAALGERGEKAKPSLAALSVALNDPSPELRTTAAVAVAKITGKDRSSDVLLAVARSVSVRPAVRASALRGLSEIPAAERYAVTALVRDPTTPAEVREAAQQALAK